jgi:hypothetical protein
MITLCSTCTKNKAFFGCPLIKLRLRQAQPDIAKNKALVLEWSHCADFADLAGLW